VAGPTFSREYSLLQLDLSTYNICLQKGWDSFIALPCRSLQKRPKSGWRLLFGLALVMQILDYCDGDVE
jgi:hypothetical protein